MRFAGRLLKAWAVGCVLLLVMGASCQKRPDVPRAEVVEKPVRKFKALDEALTAPCAKKAEGPLSEVIDVARKRGEALDECAGRMDDIRAMQPVVEDE